MKPYPGKKQIVLLFFLLFALKFLTAYFLRYLLSCAPVGYHLDELVIRGHDYFSYHAAMENYIQTGQYYFFNGKENVYAGRLPHFSLLYLFFRQFLNIAYTNFMVLVVQIGLECVALLFLAVLAARLTRSSFSFYLTLTLGVLSVALTFYSIIVLPDSLSVSFLIFFSYFFYGYLVNPSSKLLLFSGLFLGLVTVLKPHLGMLYLPVGFYFLKGFSFTKNKIGLVFRNTMVVSLPLLLLLLPWVLRNYQIYNRFIPFTVTIIAGYNYTDADLACRRYLQTFGEDLLYWDEKSAGHYFKFCQDSCTYQLPNYIYTSKYGRSDIEAVRRQYQELQQNFTEKQDKEVALAFDKLTQIYIQEKPFQYQVGARLTSIWKFVYDAGTYYLPIRESSICFKPYHLVIRYLQYVLYGINLIMGFIGLVLLVRENWQHLFLLLIPVYLLLFFPIFLRWTEGRYFLHSYPFLLLGLVYLIHCLRLRFVKSFGLT